MPERLGYIAEQNEGGTWNILDVPIFSKATLDTDDGGGHDFDDDWMRGALEWHQFKVREDSYLEPLNVHHNSDKRGKIHAGRFLPTRIAPFEFDGAEQATIFADLLRIPADVYEQIKAGVISYLSVECNNVRNARFSALALMPDTSPQFKYPPITIREERPVRSRTTEATSVAASESRQFSPLALSANEGGLRRTTTMRKLLKTFLDRTSGLYTFEFSDGTTSTSRNPRAFEFAEDEDDKEGEGAEAEEGPGLDVGAICKAIESGDISVADFAAIQAAMDAAGGGGATEETGAAAPGDNPVEPAEMSEAARTRIADAHARAVAAENRVAAIEAREARETALASARTEIESLGIVVQDAEFAEAYDGCGGKPGLDLFVSSLKMHGKRGASAPGAGTTISRDALPDGFEFSENPEIASRQLAAHRQYDAAGAFTRKNYTREQFVSNMVRS